MSEKDSEIDGGQVTQSFLNHWSKFNFIGMEATEDF